MILNKLTFPGFYLEFPDNVSLWYKNDGLSPKSQDACRIFGCNSCGGGALQSAFEIFTEKEKSEDDWLLSNSSILIWNLRCLCAASCPSSQTAAYCVRRWQHILEKP